MLYLFIAIAIYSTIRYFYFMLTKKKYPLLIGVYQDADVSSVLTSLSVYTIISALLFASVYFWIPSAITSRFLLAPESLASFWKTLIDSGIIGAVLLAPIGFLTNWIYYGFFCLTGKEKYKFMLMLSDNDRTCIMLFNCMLLIIIFCVLSSPLTGLPVVAVIIGKFFWLDARSLKAIGSDIVKIFKNFPLITLLLWALLISLAIVSKYVEPYWPHIYFAVSIVAVIGVLIIFYNQKHKR